jgi:oligoendopeptidase F
MHPIYSFDPYDWATITPLFVTLSNAPISEGGFVDWLTQWNELDIAVYDAWTMLKRRSYANTVDATAERAYNVFTREMFSTYLGWTNTLAARALALQPEPPMPEYRQLWRRWHNQTTLFHPNSLALQAKISELESSYRELTRHIEQLPGDALAHWMARRANLNDLMQQLVQLRHALAQMSGLSTFLAYRWRELNRLDYSIEDCQSFHGMVEQVVVPVVSELHAANVLRATPPAITDPAILNTGAEQILTHIDPAFGALFRTMRPNYLDLGSRVGKADTNEAWFFPLAGMPYVHMASPNAATLLHESGHAIHFYHSFHAQQSLWNFGGPEEFQEFVAIGLDMLGWPYYDQAVGGFYTATESRAGRQAVLQFYLEGLAQGVMEDAFEHWVYSQAPGDVTPAALDAKWLEVKQRFMPWNTSEASEEEAKTGWQRWNWSLFRLPLYTITYPIAIVGVCQLGLLVQQDRARAVSNYKAVLSLGNTETLSELFRIAGITFPFTRQAVESAVQFAHEQYLQLS